MNPIIRPWRQVLDFRGRATRTEYALFHVSGIIGLILFQLVSIFVTAAMGGVDSGTATAVQMGMALMFGIGSLVLVASFLIGHVSIGIRRLHDHGEPGLKYLLTFIPLIGFIFWLMMIFTRGDDYENDYGPDPREPEQIGTEQLGAVFE